jgi:glycosyltransferase involved in cell wall biosynthesis
MIGRLVRLKGYYDYMEAARILKEQGAPIKFLAIGLATPEKADAISPDELIAQHGLKGTLQYLGVRNDVRELIAAMDTLVLASYAEGIPRVLMEAAAMGKAAVGTSVRGTREVIVDGETGYLVPARDPAALADGIRRLLSDRQRARVMGAAARRRAEAHFDERHYFWRTDIEYRRLLKEERLDARIRGLNPLGPEAVNLDRALGT